MVFVRIIEIAGLVGVAWFLLTQWILPAMQGRKLFPFFRKTGKLEQDLIEATQDVYDARLAEAVEQTRNKTAETKAVKEEVKNETQQ